MPTYLWRFAIYLLSVEGYTSDILLKKTATVGKDLHITCSFAQSEVGLVSIERDNTDEVTMNVTNSCGLLYCNANYDYFCNERKIILTIPGIFVQDSLHGSRWKCHIKSADIYSEALLLYVNVPITKVALTATPYDKSPVGMLAGSIQHFTCTTNPGRPPSQIQWYLSGDNITGVAIAQPDACKPGCNDKVISSSVLLYTGNIKDNGKTIHCTAVNVDQQSVRSLDRTIDIVYIPNKEPVNGAAVGVGTAFAVILVTLGVTSLIIILYRKRRFTKQKENSNRRIYESGLDEPRQTAETDEHVYSELQDIKPESKQKQERSEKSSNTIVEFREARSITNGKICENMNISPNVNEKQIHQKDTNLYVNMDF